MSHRLTVYNNVGLTSKASEEIRTEENYRFRQLHIALARITSTMSEVKGNLANIRINLILPEYRVIVLHLRC